MESQSIQILKIFLKIRSKLEDSHFLSSEGKVTKKCHISMKTNPQTKGVEQTGQEWALGLSVEILVTMQTTHLTVLGLNSLLWLLTPAFCQYRVWEAVVMGQVAGVPETHKEARTVFAPLASGSNSSCRPDLVIADIWRVNQQIAAHSLDFFLSSQVKKQ